MPERAAGQAMLRVIASPADQRGESRRDDVQMKAFAQWDDWQAERRGVSR